MKSLYDQLAQLQNDGMLQIKMVTAILLKDVLMQRWDAQKPDQTKTDMVLAGTKVRIWMVSRFGDVGITDDLSAACCGYDARVGGDQQVRHPGRPEDYLSDVMVDGKPIR